MLHRSLAALLVAVAIITGSVLVPLAAPAAGSPADPRPEAVADPLAELTKLNKELADADAEIAELAAAKKALDTQIDQATARVESTDAEIASTTTEIAVLKEEIRDRAVAAYIGGGTGGGFLDALGDDDPNDALTRTLYIEIRAKSDGELADELDQAVTDLAELKKQIVTDRSTARKRRARLVTKTDLLRSARDARATDVAKLKAIIEAVHPAGTGTNGIALCNIEGTQVACSIGPKLSAMIAAARADGVDLTGGGGYRSAAGQIATRKANCGTSDYAIYGMPASSCSPPTARPGSSQHEVGLAIDMARCDTRSTPCYRWLASHAAAYGFKNLPSESWHWSTTGS